ncbi:MAG: IclR family transcriptional regulator [Proteobacteria bacterium]|nr:IclR family transcriptional regulator [Pseudomonadota bacterium]MBU1388395.1 IclR family transcriptional regulator [Pseudomonadota bacterium]MBU1542781.1 IclR family transcriptional regulator [Pseudomonadota bacterium]MBU2430653.1 IclR family transcriptional regulator [Pseudomonadota bacterium]MBU2480140.1 IclR family transcriptional regulator [Pseudomonadota bacterium]
MTRETPKLNSVEKTLEIMLKFKDAKPSWGIRELASQLNFSPATVQRILQTLKSYEFVRQDPDTRQYFIGTVFYRFLENLNNSNHLVRTGRRFMETLLARTKETVHLNIIASNLRICINNMESANELKASMPVGHQSPLYAGASAKCLLAFSTQQFQDTYFKTEKISPITSNTIVQKNKLFEELDRIKKTGYAISLGERTPGLGSISAPVFDYKNQVIASLSLAIPEIRFQDKDHRSCCIEILTATAKSFSKEMGQNTNIP